MAISFSGLKLALPGRARPEETLAVGQGTGSSPGASAPGFGRLPLERQLMLLALLVIGCLALGVTLSYLYSKRTQDRDAYINATTRMSFLTQRMAKGAEQAALGNAGAFDQLKESADDFGRALDVLVRGGDLDGRTVPASPDSVQEQLQNVGSGWAVAQKDVGQILAAREDLVNLQRNVQSIGTWCNQLAARAEELTALLLQNNVSVAQVSQANRLAVLAQRMARGANEMLAARSIDSEVAFLFKKDTDAFRDSLAALRSGGETLARDGETRAKLEEISGIFGKYEASAAAVSQRVNKVAQAKAATSSLFGASEALLNATGTALSKYRSELSTETLYVPAVISFMLALAALGLLIHLYLADVRRRAEISEREIRRNQEAILRLLNEMGDLADGDLTVHAQVTEDITGAIADSMNYTVEELRSLVLGVNKASTQVTEKTQEAKTVSDQLLDATRRQSQEIEETSAQVMEVVQSINTVSASAEESARVAQRSLSAAEQGQLAVLKTIQGMHEMREQIQETSKRIKRLGESSQMIGEIVELISDITEQTNVLALNAAIQAAAAGEAGRGFSVVAEEVQRLAERSTEATKQIAAIVRTIQTDTHDAAVAMEKSTQGVVEGTKLSDAAGQALSEIGQVSKQLADLIQSISAATASQVVSTDQVAKNMEDILHITRQTTDGTLRTAQSVTDLSDLAQELKSSVSGFKL